MTLVDEIIKKINEIECPSEGWVLFKKDNRYYGKGRNGEIVFAIDSNNISQSPSFYKTKYLLLLKKCNVKVLLNQTIYNKRMSMLILNCLDNKYIETFIRLSLIDHDLDDEKLFIYFLEFKNLFSEKNKYSYSELQGLYGELFAILFLKKKYLIDISSFYQKEKRRKFDFSISDNKKIEIKTTLRQERVHHFLHQQLDIERRDILILSLMLQKDDEGLSLLSLIEMCKMEFSDNFLFMLVLDNIILNYNRNILDEMRFNSLYLAENIKLFLGSKIPRIKEKNVDGVYNVEYDVDLSNIENMDFTYINDWLLNN